MRPIVENEEKEQKRNWIETLNCEKLLIVNILKKRTK